MTGPLSGIRVLDLTRALAGPYCTQLLGDMGAEIVKVESPVGGDDSRRWGPFWNGESCYFLAANKNKKSIAIDLKSAAGHQIVLALAERSDVLVENFRPGTMTRLGLGYDSLAELNAGLVYCSLSGYGQDGPRAADPAFDLAMQGFCGLMSITGHPDQPPVRAGLPVTDFGAGLLAALGIIMALYSREQSGLGQRVETSLLEGQISWMAVYLLGYLADGTIPKGLGSGHHFITPYRVFKASDGYFVLAVGNDVQWQRLCRSLGTADLAQDPRFDTNAQRLAHRDVLDSILERLFLGYAVDELLEVLSGNGIPCSPVNTVDRVVTDAQVKHVGMLSHVAHPKIPDLELAGIPIRLSRDPGCIQSAPPLLGEHTDPILVELGYSDEQILSLRRDGVVA